MSDKAKTRHNNAMESFFARWGLRKSWVAAQIGMSHAAFSQNLHTWGFNAQDAEKIESLFKSLSKNLESFNLSSDNSKDINILRNNYGFKYLWIAAQLGLRETSLLQHAVNRQNGFRTEEKETLKQALNEAAQAFKTFKVPESIIRKAA